MDDPRPLKLAEMRRSLPLIRGFTALLLGALCGCLSSDPKTLPAVSESAFVALAKSVAQWRDLPLKRDLELDILSAEAENRLRQNISTDFYRGAPTAQIEAVYKSIGLLPNDSDLNAALVESKKALPLIRYNTLNGRISVSPGARRLGAPYEKTDPSAAQELPAVLGIVRALQEQHFNWRERKNSIVFEDRRLALRAVAAGDALLAAVSRASGESHEKLSPARLGVSLQIAAEIDRSAARLPDFLREQAVFPYRAGSQFVLWALAAKGWHGVNALYADPPQTTAQVLHPEKYFIRRENPLRFFPPVLLRRLKESSVIEQSLGESLIGALLRTEHSSTFAAETAAGWRGDQLFAFQKDGKIAIFWFSSWSDETGAQQFVRAYRRVLESRHRVRFDAVAATKESSLIAADRDGRAWLLQSRGAVVLTMQSAAADRLTELAEEAWKDLEIEPDTAPVAFESAKRSVNFR